MDGLLGALLKPFKNLVIILLILMLICICFFTMKYSSYAQNIFEIKLNGNLMYCYYTEKYNSWLLLNATNRGYNSVSNYINEIDLSDKIILDVNEYEVYYKSGRRKSNDSNWYKSDNFNYKLINNENLKIQIKRMDKILYDGAFISDLSDYINERGRYYIHIYSTRKEGIFTTIKTHISFNVVVGGGNRE